MLLACALAAASACRRAKKDERTRAAPPAPAPAANAAPVPPPPRGKQITLLYSSNLSGDYEQCGCPVHPMGGVGRRATVLDRARAEADATLVLDAGDLFMPQLAALGREPDDGEIERRARLLTAAFGRMGTTALLPGERDLAIGVPRLRRLAKQAHIPLIASNLYGADGKRLFEADRIIDAAGVKIGLFGVTVPTSPDDATLKAAGIEARDPKAAAREEVASLRARGAKLIVAMVHVGSGDANRKLVGDVPGIDWAVLGHTGMNYQSPEKAGSARMLEAMMQGKHVGRLDLHVIGDQLVFKDRGERSEIETILADHKHQLTDYDKRLGETDPATMRDYYEQRRKEVEAAIARETALLQMLPAQITTSWFENRIIPLDAYTPDRTGRRASRRRVQQGEREAGGGREAGGSGHRVAAPEARQGRADRTDRADLFGDHRLRRLPPAGARAMEDDQARARAVGAGARRTRPQSLVRRLPRHGLPATGRPDRARGRARAVRQRRLRVLPRKRQGPPRGRRQEDVDCARRARGDLPGVPHRRRDERRIRLQEVPPGDCGPRARGPAGARTVASSIVRGSR